MLCKQTLMCFEDLNVSRHKKEKVWGGGGDTCWIVKKKKNSVIQDEYEIHKPISVPVLLFFAPFELNIGRH